MNGRGLDEHERIRLDTSTLVATHRRDQEGAPAFVGVVTTTNPQAGKFFLVNPLQVTGYEAEGSSGLFSAPNPATRIAVYPIGYAAIGYGDYLIARFVDFRWVAERGPSGPVVPPHLTLAICVLGCEQGVAETIGSVTSGIDIAISGPGGMFPSAMTDHLGCVKITGPFVDGGVYTVESDFFAGRCVDPTFTYHAGETSINVTFSPASGFVCTGVCNFPLSRTMLFTPTFGDPYIVTWFDGGMFGITRPGYVDLLDPPPAGHPFVDTDSGRFGTSKREFDGSTSDCDGTTDCGDPSSSIATGFIDDRFGTACGTMEEM